MENSKIVSLFVFSTEHTFFSKITENLVFVDVLVLAVTVPYLIILSMENIVENQTVIMQVVGYTIISCVLFEVGILMTQEPSKERSWFRALLFGVALLLNIVFVLMGIYYCIKIQNDFYSVDPFIVAITATLITLLISLGVIDMCLRPISRKVVERIIGGHRVPLDLGK